MAPAACPAITAMTKQRSDSGRRALTGCVFAQPDGAASFGVQVRCRKALATERHIGDVVVEVVSIPAGVSRNPHRP